MTKIIWRAGDAGGRSLRDGGMCLGYYNYWYNNNNIMIMINNLNVQGRGCWWRITSGTGECGGCAGSSPTAGACTRVSFDRPGSIYFRIYFFIVYFCTVFTICWGVYASEFWPSREVCAVDAWLTYVLYKWFAREILVVHNFRSFVWIQFPRCLCARLICTWFKCYPCRLLTIRVDWLRRMRRAT